MQTFRGSYGPHAAFVAPARARPDLWRTLLCLVGFAVLYVVALRLFLQALLAISGEADGQAVLDRLARGATPGDLVQLLFSHIEMGGAVVVVTLLVLHRGFATLIGGWHAAWRCFVWVAVPLLALWLVMLPLAALDPSVTRNLTLSEQAPWLVPVLIGLLVQTGSEELLFRGLLQQQLAARFDHPAVWMLVPACLFGLLHYAPDAYGPMAWFVVGWAVLFGLAAADLTARTGNLGAAVALHFANNASSVLMVGQTGNLDGMALFHATSDLQADWSDLPSLATEVLALLVAWLAARLILRV